MKKVLMIIITTGMLFSCKQPSPDTAIAKAPIDSLITDWSNHWNNHDSAGVRNLFMPDAFLTDENLIAANADEISAKFISPNIRVVNNFKASKFQEWSSNDRAGYTGIYELNVVVNDSIIAKPKGVFTLNWIKTDNGAWKITTAVIYSFIEQK